MRGKACYAIPGYRVGTRGNTPCFVGRQYASVQNMVLDNCLSTIKHETIYYPNKIKQIIGRLNTQNLPEKDEREAVETITELIEYYKGIFTILSSCAARQLEEVTFRRNTIPVQELFDAAGKYFRKVTKNRTEKVELIIEPMDAKVSVT